MNVASARTVCSIAARSRLKVGSAWPFGLSIGKKLSSVFCMFASRTSTPVSPVPLLSIIQGHAGCVPNVSYSSSEIWAWSCAEG